MIFLHVYDCEINTKAFSRQKLMENLSHYLDKNQQEINIEYNENGKPDVKGLYFSVSHCRDKIAQIFTRDSEVGIDIEFNSPKRSFLKLAQRYFHPYESKTLEDLPPENALNLFYNLWTAKEAVCKAHGGRLWYYLSDNYLTKNLEIAPKINGMNLQSLPTITDFSLAIASAANIKKIIHV